MKPRKYILPERLCLFFILSIGASVCQPKDGILGTVGGTDDGHDAGEATTGCPNSPGVTISEHDTCTGRLAASQFTNALCACGNFQMGDVLTTRGFDSNQGVYLEGDPTDTGAPIGVNGNYTQFAGATDIGGSFSIAGGGPLQLMGALNVRGDFFSAGNVSVTGKTTVSRHAWLGGNFSGFGVLQVGGDLHYAGTIPPFTTLVSGTKYQQPVAVAKPCPCEELVPIAALIDAAKENNDNIHLGLESPEALASVTGASRRTLSCGRGYLSRIEGIGSLAIHVTGNVALFIDGSIDLLGTLSFDVDPGAEIDVFVKGNLKVLGTLALANKNRPSAGRMWIDGTQSITLASPFIGNLYAPRAHVGALIGVEVWGAIFAGDFSAGTFARFFYDRAIQTAGASCPAPVPPAGVCTQCQWCPGSSACIDGLCGSCKSDSDCCSLSVCSSGHCQPLMVDP